MESIFERDLIVTPDYCDASGALSPLAAFTIFQGIAAQHAEALGVGSAAMAKKGEFWLTVHTRVDLFARAYLMDELSVRTWAESCSERDVRTYRSYTLSRGETVIARGKTEWAILGPEKKVIRFGDSGFPKDYPFPAESAIPEKLQRFHEKFEDTDLFSHYAVRPTDIDLGRTTWPTCACCSTASRQRSSQAGRSGRSSCTIQRLASRARSWRSTKSCRTTARAASLSSSPTAKPPRSRA